MARGDGYDPLYEAIGERIAHARGAADLSQAKLALKVGITRVSIVNIEHGRQRAPVHVLWQIAKALGIDAARLIPSARELAARDAPVQLDPRIVTSIERAAQDDPTAKRLLTDFIRKATNRIEGQDAGSDDEAR
jgi:transcriptional regulator with XRE-family HTH domain